MLNAGHGGNTVYSSSLSPEEILYEKREDEDGRSRWAVTTTFFQIKNMEASETAAVPDSRNNLPQKVFKDGRTNARLNTTSLHHRIRH